MIVTFVQNDASSSASPMALFSTNKEVREFNRRTIEALQLECVVVVAEDSAAENIG